MQQCESEYVVKYYGSYFKVGVLDRKIILTLTLNIIMNL